MRRSRIVLVVVPILLVMSFAMISNTRNREQDIVIEMISFNVTEILGYRFLLMNDGTLVSQRGFMRTGDSDFLGAVGMRFAIRRNRTSLSEQEMVEIFELVQRISQTYPSFMLRHLDYKLGSCEYFDEQDEEYFVLSTLQLLLLYDDNVYGASVQTESLFRLGALLHRLSPL